MLANCECTKLQYSSCKDIWRSYISSFSNFNANTFKYINVDYFSAKLERKVVRKPFGLYEFLGIEIRYSKDKTKIDVSGLANRLHRLAINEELQQQ